MSKKGLYVVNIQLLNKEGECGFGRLFVRGRAEARIMAKKLKKVVTKTVIKPVKETKLGSDFRWSNHMVRGLV